MVMVTVMLLMMMTTITMMTMMTTMMTMMKIIIAIDCSAISISWESGRVGHVWLEGESKCKISFVIIALKGVNRLVFDGLVFYYPAR